MTPKEFVKMVEQVTYKPGWKLDAMIDGPKMLVEVRIGYQTADVRDPAKRIPLMAQQQIGWHELEVMEDEAVMQWLRGMIESMEVHELDEWLKIRGKRVGVPHDPGT